MEGMEYFYELFVGLPRGGPGDNESTRKAFEYLKDLALEPHILDIGCGHGMQTIELARISNGKIIALDNYQPFLDILMNKAKEEGVTGSITPKNQSMLEMDFNNETFDIIWSEGALFVMGFQNGLKKCNQLLKNKGYFVVSEAVLLLPNLPKPLKKFWDEVYPVIKDINSNISLIQNEGFEILSHFTLPKSCWIDFYSQMNKKIKELKKKYHDNKVALKVFEACEKEIRTYQIYSDYYGYEFFIMQKKDQNSSR
jgi:ubiquinone/menaquinone biosynthesis C-methylase UbiE